MGTPQINLPEGLCDTIESYIGCFDYFIDMNEEKKSYNVFVLDDDYVKKNIHMPNFEDYKLIIHFTGTSVK